jgi:hypothetical protein
VLQPSKISSQGIGFLQWKQKKNLPATIRLTKDSCNGPEISQFTLADSMRVHVLNAATMKALKNAGDSIYAYKADELFTKRNIVEVSNDISSWQNSQPKRGRYVRRHGRRVWVPYKNQPATAASKRKRRGGSGGNTAYHNISGGETLSSIAKKYHTSVKHLQKINGIKGTNIRSGEKIKVK